MSSWLFYPPSQKAAGVSPRMNAETAGILSRVEGFHAVAGSAASCKVFAGGEKARCHGRKAVELYRLSRKKQ